MFHQIFPALPTAYILGITFQILEVAVFLFVASVVIKYGSNAIRKSFSKKYSEPVILDLIKDVTRIFMWFWVILVALSMLGFGGIASSMGTASGFVALGVAYALKDVISDTVAGVYLAQDRDFNSGNTVEADSVKGEIENVGLRKTRIRLESGDLRVINNSDVEKKWTKFS
jgi:small-conductance mechanosensitive channel